MVSLLMWMNTRGQPLSIGVLVIELLSNTEARKGRDGIWNAPSYDRTGSEGEGAGEGKRRRTVRGQSAPAHSTAGNVSIELVPSILDCQAELEPVDEQADRVGCFRSSCCVLRLPTTC